MINYNIQFNYRKRTIEYNGYWNNQLVMGWFKYYYYNLFQFCMQEVRLSNLVAKEMQRQRLTEGIKHTQTRNRYRNYKLKQKYQLPEPQQHKFYLYSNYHGNEFILKKELFTAANFNEQTNVFFIVTQIQKQINSQLYKLWKKNKNFSKKQQFYWNEKVVRWSLIFMSLLFLISCIAWSIISTQYPDQFSQLQPTLEKIILFIIMVTVTVNIALLIKTFCSKYKMFNYDEEVVKMVLRVLLTYQARLEIYWIYISCDRQATWICFNNQRLQKSQQSNLGSNYDERHSQIE